MVNVEYRLAPEYKYPACVQDAMCAATWVMKNKIQIGIEGHLLCSLMINILH